LRIKDCVIALTIGELIPLLKRFIIGWKIFLRLQIALHDALESNKREHKGSYNRGNGDGHLGDLRS